MVKKLKYFMFQLIKYITDNLTNKNKKFNNLLYCGFALIDINGIKIKVYLGEIPRTYMWDINMFLLGVCTAMMIKEIYGWYLDAQKHKELLEALDAHNKNVLEVGDIKMEKARTTLENYKKLLEEHPIPSQENVDNFHGDV